MLEKDSKEKQENKLQKTHILHKSAMNRRQSSV